MSYQYLDSLATPNTPTTILSPIVSYQYFDWLGDENVTFQNSAAVSYYFSGGVSVTFQGLVQTIAGAPLPGVSVILKRYGTVFWQGASDANGHFNPAALPATNFTVEATMPGFRDLRTNIAGYAGGNGSLLLTLAPLPETNACIEISRNPALSALAANAVGASKLKGYLNGTFTEEITLESDRPTVILTHGWRSSPDGPDAWALGMAALIQSHSALSPKPNIVVWDWTDAAHGGLLSIVGKIDVAAKQGAMLGEALQQALGTGYHQHIHFIGHSLGTIVNRYACDYVHAGFPSHPGFADDRSSLNAPFAWLDALTTPHVTLLDEAEVANAGGSAVVTSTYAAGALTSGASFSDVAKAVTGSLKSPLPAKAHWIDNYISAVGIQHDEAVNVCLLKTALTRLNPVAAHAYSYGWYASSIQPSQSYPIPMLGFGRSFEKALTFPPAGTGMQPGSLWIEKTTTADPLDLALDPHPFGNEATLLLAAAYTVTFGPKVEEEAVVLASKAVQAGEASAIALAEGVNEHVIKPLDDAGRAVMAGFQARVHAAGEFGGTVIYKSGMVVSQTTQKAGRLIDATEDYAENLFGSLSPDSLLAGPGSVPFLGIRLKTQAVAPSPNGGSAAGSGSQPAYAWMTIRVPDDAGFLAFDFTVTGAPNEDRIVCAINEENVFNLPAKYAPDGVPSSTDLIDVSAFAGQEIELFFGLTGGTSTNCEAAIDGIRFITVPTPKIALAPAGGNVAIKWPAAATGWVLETSDSLAPGSWQVVPTGEGVVVDRGVATLEQAVSGARRFYRLRRVQ